jgi:hypothetical protein
MEDQDKPLEWYDALVREYPKMEEWAVEQRGVKLKTLQRAVVGFNGRSWTFPCKKGNRWMQTKFIRYKADGTKDIQQTPGARAMLWPARFLQDAPSVPVLLCEGEWDALLAEQGSKGLYVALTGTGGSGTPPLDLSPLANREVFVAYDCDGPGQTGAEKIARSLRKVGARVFILDLSRFGLPKTENHGADISDFFLKHGGNADKLKEEFDRLRAQEEVDSEAEREARIEEQLEHLKIQQAARSRLSAEGWEAPPAQGSWADQMDEPDEPINWLIPELAFEGANVVVNAQAKSGKTSLILNVAHSLLSGDPLFGNFDVRALPAGRSIAWWNAELNETQAKKWLRDFDFPRAQDFYPAHLRGFDMPFDVERVEDWAVEWLRERRVSVWLIDPLSALFRGEENSNTEMGEWLSAIDRIKRRAGVETSFLVHHASETVAPGEGDDPNSGRLVKGRGASRLLGWADVSWSYSGRFDEPRYLSALGRDVDLPPFGGLHMAPGSRLLRWNGMRSTPTQDRRNALALDAVDKVAGHGGPMKAGELQAALPGKKADTKRRAIEYAVHQGWLRSEPGPQNSTLYSLGDVDPRRIKLSNTRSAT